MAGSLGRRRRTTCCESRAMSGRLLSLPLSPSRAPRIFSRRFFSSRFHSPRGAIRNNTQRHKLTKKKTTTQIGSPVGPFSYWPSVLLFFFSCKHTDTYALGGRARRLAPPLSRQISPLCPRAAAEKQTAQLFSFFNSCLSIIEIYVCVRNMCINNTQFNLKKKTAAPRSLSKTPTCSLLTRRSPLQKTWRSRPRPRRPPRALFRRCSRRAPP